MDATTLENTLKNQQWVGGQSPSAADVEAYDALKEQNLSAATHPHVFAWFVLVARFTDAVRATWSAGAAKKDNKKDAKKAAPKKEDDDDMDLFGSGDDDD